MLEKNIHNISEAEAALYDRQIRLWGLDAQKRLRASRVLLIGIGGLGAEVAKNIILSGVKSITLLDHKNITEDDKCSQFLIDHDHCGQNRAAASLEKAQQLNPMVRVEVCQENIETLPELYITNHDVVCATECAKSTLLWLNEVCRKNNILFYSADVWGYFGYMFADLNNHEYAEEITTIDKKVKEGEAESQKTTVKKKSISYTTLEKSLNTDWSSSQLQQKLKRVPKAYFIMHILLEFIEKYKRRPISATSVEDFKLLKSLRIEVLEKLNVTHSVVAEDFVAYCISQLSPVCAVVGGILGQEIIKAVSQKDTPHNNFFFYDGLEGSGMVDFIAQSQT